MRCIQEHSGKFKDKSSCQGAAARMCESKKFDLVLDCLMDIGHLPLINDIYKLLKFFKSFKAFQIPKIILEKS